MRVFLYEFISGGGCFHPAVGEPPAGTLLAEGLAMWRAVYDDLRRIADVEVITTRDARLPATNADVITVQRYDPQLLKALARQCDVALVIAPEFENLLWQLVCDLESTACRLLGPDSSFIQLTADKTRTVEHLAAAGIRVPAGELLNRGKPFATSLAFPMVAKQNDGAGSMGCVLDTAPAEPFLQDMRLEECVSGTACSQSFLCGHDRKIIACPPMRQRIADGNSLRYLGGERLPESLVPRASDLARRVMEALPPAQGYVGVDMMLGEPEDGSRDFVLEVNPRMTTSYIGLRQLTDGNLMRALIDFAEGRRPAIQFNADAVRFCADGTIAS